MVPLFAVIGQGNKVYWNDNERDFRAALNFALNEFVYEGIEVFPVGSKYYTEDFYEEIDLNTVFVELQENPLTFTIESNADPSVASADINGNILILSGKAGKIAETVIAVKAVSGEHSETDTFTLAMKDPLYFASLEEGFEGAKFPPSFWTVRYNTAVDGGLNGNNLKETAGRTTWFRNTPDHPWWGSDYIYSGEGSAFIEYWAEDFNWLITPQMKLYYGDYFLNFRLWFSSSVFETKFSVLIDGGSGWDILLSYDGTTPDNEFSEEISLSLSEYAGQTVRIAFVYEYTDGYELALDDIRVFSGTQASKSIEITSPLNGSVLYETEQFEITWTDNIEEDVRIELYENGIYNMTIAESVPSSGSYSWTVPADMQGSGYQVRVTSVEVPYLYSASEGSFLIDPSGISDELLPFRTALHQNYPNPFNPVTSISFDIAAASETTLSVFNYKGELVKQLFNGFAQRGTYSLEFDASGLTSGIYLYRLETGSGTHTRKLILLK